MIQLKSANLNSMNFAHMIWVIRYPNSEFTELSQRKYSQSLTLNIALNAQCNFAGYTVSLIVAQAIVLICFLKAGIEIKYFPDIFCIYTCVE